MNKYRSLEDDEIIIASDQMRRSNLKEWFSMPEWDVGKKASYFNSGNFSIRRRVNKDWDFSDPQRFGLVEVNDWDDEYETIDAEKDGDYVSYEEYRKLSDLHSKALNILTPEQLKTYKKETRD